MSLPENQRARLARVARWARKHGWEPDAYPGCWRNDDEVTRVRLEDFGGLVIDRYPGKRFTSPPLRSVVQVSTVTEAVDVLAALGVVPAWFSSAFDSGYQLAEDLREVRDVIEATKRPARIQYVVRGVERS